jgi:carboxynorspermidine decarboxylase
MGKETHVYSPAYNHADFSEIIRICDHIVFNNFVQLERFYPAIRKSGANIESGVRINPEYSEIDTPIYNPCAENSRLGCKIGSFPKKLPPYVSGLHFHTMCEQGADVLERTVQKVEEKFGEYLYGLKWLNLGGGHHITKDGYETDRLAAIINRLQDKYDLSVYIEPGEAVALNAGYLVSTVLDTITTDGGKALAITDASAACHMPDVLEMPYRPEIIGAGRPAEKAFTYRLGGPTCLAGDVMGDYSFDAPLAAGDKLVFLDMAIYTMVKNNTFNGMKLPSVILLKTDGSFETVKTFGYEDFKSRL